MINPSCVVFLPEPGMRVGEDYQASIPELLSEGKPRLFFVVFFRQNVLYIFHERVA